MNGDEYIDKTAEDKTMAEVGREIETTDSTLSAKEAERRRIKEEIDEFLKKGGEITKVDTNVMSDPPKRPESNYGGQPI